MVDKFYLFGNTLNRQSRRRSPGAALLLAAILSLTLPTLAQAQKAGSLPKGTATLPMDAGTKAALLTVAKPYLVKVSRFAVSGGDKPGDTVTLTMGIDTSGDGTRDIPWSFSDGTKVIANGTASAVNATKSVDVSATFRLPSAETVLHFQGTVDAQNTLKEPDGERGNNVSQVVDLVVHLAAPAGPAGVVKNAITSGITNTTNTANTGSKVVGGVVVGSADAASSTVKTGTQAVTGALTHPNGGTIDVGTKAPSTGATGIPAPDPVKHAVDTSLRTTTGTTSSVGPKLIDGGKGTATSIAATAGTTVTNSVATLTAYEASLGNLVQVHLDSGTAKVDANSATLDGGVTLSLKSNAAAKLKFNGHLVLRGAAGMPTANEAGKGPAAAVRSWVTAEGSGAVTVTLGSRSISPSGNRSLSGNGNALFISASSIDVPPCAQDTSELRLDNTGLATLGKLRCGGLTLENSNIRISPAGQLAGTGTLSLFDHNFNFIYDFTGGTLKAQQTASWPASGWVGVAGVAEHRVTNPSVTVAINGTSVSRTFSTGGVELRSTAQVNNRPLSSASLSSANFALGADNSVRLALPSLPEPPDPMKAARDACKKAADDAYNEATRVPEAVKSRARDKAKAVCDADRPAPPSFNNVPSSVSAAVSSFLSGAARDVQAAAQTAASNASTTVGQAVATGRLVASDLQNRVATGANTVGNAVGSGVITAGNNIASYGEDNYGGQVTYSPRSCDAPIGIALAAPPSQKKAAEAAARNCIVKASTANGFFWAPIYFKDHCGSPRTDQTCLTELNKYQAAEDGQTAGRQIGETIALGLGWDNEVRKAARAAATKVINACVKVANGDVSACGSSSAGSYTVGGKNGGQPTGGPGSTGGSSSSSGCTAVPDGHGGLHYPAGCSTICRAGYVKAADQVRCVKTCYPPEHNITDDLCGRDTPTATPATPAEETCAQLTADGTGCMRMFCNQGRIDVGGKCESCDAVGDVIVTDSNNKSTCVHRGG